jgi:stage V sporulation protein G
MSIDTGGDVTPSDEFHPRITEVNVQPVNQDRLKAFVTIVFDNNFVVHGVKIIQAADRTFVAMPTRRNPAGQQTDVCHPINRPFREYMEDTILRAWQRKLEDMSLDPGRPPDDDGEGGYAHPSH